MQHFFFKQQQHFRIFWLRSAFYLFIWLFPLLYVWVTWRINNETRGSGTLLLKKKRKKKEKQKKKRGRVKMRVSVSIIHFVLVILFHTTVYWRFSHQICLSLFLNGIFSLWGWGVTGDGFLGCLLVHTWFLGWFEVTSSYDLRTV